MTIPNKKLIHYLPKQALSPWEETVRLKLSTLLCLTLDSFKIDNPLGIPHHCFKDLDFFMSKIPDFSLLGSFLPSPSILLLLEQDQFFLSLSTNLNLKALPPQFMDALLVLQSKQAPPLSLTYQLDFSGQGQNNFLLTLSFKR